MSTELHKLEIEVEEIKQTSGAESLGGIIDAIKGRKDALYLQIAACSRLGDDPSNFNDQFKQNRDIKSIEREIVRFGSHSRMAPLFIPENLPAVVAYRNLSFFDEASNLINILVSNDQENYLNQIYLMSDSLFDGSISLAIKKFNPRINEPEAVILERIKHEETFAAGSSNENNYINFHFYKLHNFSLVDKDKIDDPLDKIIMRLKDKLTLDLYLTGEITKSGVRFQVNITPSLSIFEDLNPNPLKFKSLGEIVCGTSGDLGGDQIGQQLTDLLASQTSAAAPEATLIAAAITLVKNLITVDTNSRKNMLEAYVNEVRASKASFRDYYTDFVKSSFVIFLNKHSMELSSADQLNPICENIYKNLMVWINSFIHDHLAEFREYKEKFPLRDDDTIKLFFAYDLIIKPEVENHHKAKRKKQIM